MRPETGSGPRTRRILVVDDDELLREVARTALEIVGGWGVITATSGVEAAARAAADEPDAILLDVMMPGADGPQTLAGLHSSPRTANIPVIFLTAKSQPAEIARWEGLGVRGVIRKPFDPMTLAADISALLHWDEGSERGDGR